MANWLSEQRFRGDGGGLGMKSWDRAIDAGYTPRQVAEATEGAGLSIGWRLRDLVGELKRGFDREGTISGLESERDTYRGERDTARGNLTSAQSERDAARSRADIAEGKIAGYDTQIVDYKDQLADYTKKYSEATDLASDYQGKWAQAQGDYESAKAMADAYREEAVSRQLSGLQSGRTAAGVGRTAGLASGRGAVSRAARDKEDALNIEKKISAEDSVLSRKGPVVTRIQGGSNRTPSQSAGLASGGGGRSYYAGRFG